MSKNEVLGNAMRHIRLDCIIIRCERLFDTGKYYSISNSFMIRSEHEPTSIVISENIIGRCVELLKYCLINLSIKPFRYFVGD